MKIQLDKGILCIRTEIDSCFSAISTAAMKPPTYGRPADVEFLADGSMLVSNDKRGEIYRIYYKTTNYLLIILISLGVVIVVAVAAAIVWKRRKASSYARV